MQYRVIDDSDLTLQKMNSCRVNVIVISVRRKVMTNLKGRLLSIVIRRDDQPRNPLDVDPLKSYLDGR